MKQTEETMNPCPHCSHIEPSGAFTPHPTEKQKPRQFRVLLGSVHLGDFDSLDMARAAACGSDAEILSLGGPQPVNG